MSAAAVPFNVFIDPYGGISMLRRPDFDLRQVGHVTAQRSSEILLDETSQQWYVEFRQGELSGEKMTFLVQQVATGSGYVPPEERERVLLFPTYEEAVAEEVRVIDGLRIRGQGFLVG